jgi:hypothetical protein
MTILNNVGFIRFSFAVPADSGCSPGSKLAAGQGFSGDDGMAPISRLGRQARIGPYEKRRLQGWARFLGAMHHNRRQTGRCRLVGEIRLNIEFDNEMRGVDF